MNKDYFNSRKYIILLIIVCILFTIIILKAFDYMPKPIDNSEYNGYNQSILNNNINNEQSEENTNDEDENLNSDDDDNDDDNDEDNADEQDKSGHIDFIKETTEFEEIQAPKGTVEEEIHVDYGTTDTN